MRRPGTAAFTAPYAAAIVTLDEGYQMVTNIVGVRVADLHIDMSVQVDFHFVGTELGLPYVRPSDTALAKLAKIALPQPR